MEYEDINSLKERIEDLRDKLERCISESDELLNVEVIELSRALDRLLDDYNNFIGHHS